MERNSVSFSEHAMRPYFTKLMIALFVYELTFQFGAGFVSLLGTDLFRNLYFAMILSGVTALLFAFLILGFQPHPVPLERFRIRTIVYYSFLFYGVQLLTMILDFPIEGILKAMGFSLEAAREAASGGDVGDIWQWIYSILMAPLFEELLFRGLFFGYLRRYGRLFAILMSALFFALMHANVFQFFLALFLGIVLADIRDRYGIHCSILLHLINNLFAILANHFSEEGFLSILYPLVLLIGAVVLIVSLVRSFAPFLRELKAEQSFHCCISRFFTTIPVDLMILVFLGLAALNLN